jgi:hypothetical protein
VTQPWARGSTAGVGRSARSQQTSFIEHLLSDKGEVVMLRRQRVIRRSLPGIFFRDPESPTPVGRRWPGSGRSQCAVLKNGENLSLVIEAALRPKKFQK